MQRYAAWLEHPSHMSNRRGNVRDMLEKSTRKDDIYRRIRHRQASRDVCNFLLGNVVVKRKFLRRHVNSNQIEAPARLNRPRVNAPAATAEIEDGSTVRKPTEECVRILLELLPQRFVGR